MLAKLALLACSVRAFEHSMDALDCSLVEDAQCEAAFLLQTKAAVKLAAASNTGSRSHGHVSHRAMSLVSHILRWEGECGSENFGLCVLVVALLVLLSILYAYEKSWLLLLRQPQMAIPPPLIHAKDISGRVKVEATKERWSSDWFIFHLYRVPWPVFWLIGGIVYLTLNLAFAILFLLSPNSVHVAEPPMCFDDAFWLSFQTFSTVGYGALAPATGWGHVVMALEVYVSVAYVAVFGGLLFGRVSKPNSHMAFADTICIAQSRHGDFKELHVRILNERPQSSWLDVTATLSLIVPDGENLRKVIPLKLVEDSTPLLHISWNLVHHVGEKSPLAKMKIEDLASEEAAILVFISGTDQVFERGVHATHSYYGNELKMDHEFVDMIEYKPDKIIVHNERLSDVMPVKS